MNTRRNLLIALVAILIIVPVATAGVYLVKQNYKRHHYITGTFQYGRYRGQKYRYTQEQQEEVEQQVRNQVQQQIDAMNKMHEAHPR